MVVVVGGGIAGVSCARVVHDAGVDVRVLDRGRQLGGRLALRVERVAGVEHAVDVGASYFTVGDERFAAVVDTWREAGLARVWTDTFAVLDAAGRRRTTTGPARWAATGGLRSLVEDLARGLDVRHGTDVEEVSVGPGRRSVDGDPAAAVVLAMPDPQAADLLPEPVTGWLDLERGMDWAATISVWAAWDVRWWGALDGAFVTGSPVLTWLADDGRRRGDGAPVLVAHTTAELAADHLEDPAAAVRPVLDELAALLGANPPAPRFARAHRWSLAAPMQPHNAPFGLHPGLVGVCGDGWGSRPRIEQAWLSGRLLVEALLARLA